MNIRKFFRDSSGFTLTELLVVIVLIGILASLTIPKYRKTTTKAKASEAKLMLKQVYNLQRAYYLENDVFSPSLESIGFEQDRLKTEGGSARYRIEMVEVSDTGFVAQATSVVDFDKDGVLNVWTINHQDQLVQAVPD